MDSGDLEARTPWRCQQCKFLIYNIEWQEDVAYSVPGAPLPFYFNEQYQAVCSLCFHLLTEA